MPASATAAAVSVGGGIIGSNAAKAAGKNSINAANQANQVATNVYNTNQSNLNPYISSGTNANNNLSALLGLGGNTAGAQNAFNNYLGSSNYKFTMDQGDKSVASQNAATYGSGATGKALEAYGQGLAGNTLTGYESMLSGLGGQGLNAASSLGGLGNQYASTYGSQLQTGTNQQNQANLLAASQQQGILNGLGTSLSTPGAQKALNGLGAGIQNTWNNLTNSSYGQQPAATSYNLNTVGSYNPNTYNIGGEII